MKIHVCCGYESSHVKVKLSLCFIKQHAMKTYGGNRGIVPRIINLGTR